MGHQQLVVWVVATEPPVSKPLPSLSNPAFNFVGMQVLLVGPSGLLPLFHRWFSFNCFVQVFFFHLAQLI